jgi:LPXTG-motif cell wall-anchored protein
VNPLRKTAATAIAVLALAALPSTAEAHGDGTPFDNCTEAYAAGHAHILEHSAHYGVHLDRDKDGVGCDKPPADFVPTKDDEAQDDAQDSAQDDAERDGSAGHAEDGSASDASSGEEGTALAETGGDSTTPYIAAGGAAVLLAGGALLVTVRRRRATR